LAGAASGAKITLLTDQVGGDPIRYADGVIFAKCGKIYFTDASRRFGAKAWGGTFNASVLDIVEHQASGLAWPPGQPDARPGRAHLGRPREAARRIHR
jgi:hypothetical protein